MKHVNQTRTHHRRTHRRAFTLVEVIVVVTIIALLATIVVPNVFGNLGKSRQRVALQKAGSIRSQIGIYLMNNNLSVVPDDFELSELTVGSNAPLRQKDILDPWGREFIVELNNAGAGGYQVVSYGADGEPGGEDENADVID